MRDFMKYKGVHFPSWKIYKRKGVHSYYLAHEVSEKSPRNFYLYPRVSLMGGVFYEDRLHQELRLERCTCCWVQRTFLDLSNMSECSFWKVKDRAPKQWVHFLERELDKILFCTCYPLMMGRGGGFPLERCSTEHLAHIENVYKTE